MQARALAGRAAPDSAQEPVSLCVGGMRFSFSLESKEKKNRVEVGSAVL